MTDWNRIAEWAGLGLLLLALAVAAVGLWRARRARRRQQLLQRLLDSADRLEARIKQCRQDLGQAHAAVRVIPGLPSAGSAEAGQAIATALREVLQHRLWIRDHAATAGDAELAAAADALEQAGRKIATQMDALQQAHAALDDAVQDLAEPG